MYVHTYLLFVYMCMYMMTIYRYVFGNLQIGDREQSGDLQNDDQGSDNIHDTGTDPMVAEETAVSISVCTVRYIKTISTVHVYVCITYSGIALI